MSAAKGIVSCREVMASAYDVAILGSFVRLL